MTTNKGACPEIEKLAGRLTEALAVHDRKNNDCPFAPGKRWISPDKPCPKCSADRGEPCRKRVLADAEFVDDARLILRAHAQGTQP